MGFPGPLELLGILIIVFLIFGGKRLKNIGSDLGNAIKGFKKSMQDESTKKTSDNNTVTDTKDLKKKEK